MTPGCSQPATIGGGALYAVYAEAYTLLKACMLDMLLAYTENAPILSRFLGRVPLLSRVRLFTLK